MVSKKLDSLFRQVESSNKAFEADYAKAILAYKRFDFDNSYPLAVLSVKDMLKCSSRYITRLSDLYHLSMSSGSKPFGSHEVFIHLFEPIRNMTKGMVLAISCVAMMHEAGRKGAFKELSAVAKSYSELVATLIRFDGKFSEGDRAEDKKKMKQFLDILKKDSKELLTLAEKASGKNGLKREDLDSAAVVNREW